MDKPQLYVQEQIEELKITFEPPEKSQERTLKDFIAVITFRTSNC